MSCIYEVRTAVKQNLCAPQMPADAVEPEEPRRPRLHVVDATPEKMGELLAQNPKGLLYCRDELTPGAISKRPSRSCVHLAFANRQWSKMKMSPSGPRANAINKPDGRETEEKYE